MVTMLSAEHGPTDGKVLAGAGFREIAISLCSIMVTMQLVDPQSDM
jgi:hypothetical protein